MQLHEPFSIVFTSVGRRVSLIRHFQETVKRLRLPCTIIGTDSSTDAPALHVVDKPFQTCRIDHPDYIPGLLDICRREKALLLFPLIDTDLLLLAQHRSSFAEEGTTAVVSDADLVRVAMDKHRTFEFFTSHGIGTPDVFDLDSVNAEDLRYPLFMKPADGSASKDVFVINNSRELLFFRDYISRPILQEYLAGAEHTLDVLFDFTGKVRCVVPRKRIEVRAGEVSKAVVVDNDALVQEGWRAAGCLKGARGCINLQCFVTGSGEVKFVEINPRFGGGVPLALHAGADFPLWIIRMAGGDDPGDVSTAYRKHVYMLRYDDALFAEGPNPGIAG